IVDGATILHRVQRAPIDHGGRRHQRAAFVPLHVHDAACGGAGGPRGRRGRKTLVHADPVDRAITVGAPGAAGEGELDVGQVLGAATVGIVLAPVVRGAAAL